MAESIINGGNDIDKHKLVLLCKLSLGSKGKLHSLLMKHLISIRYEPVLALLRCQGSVKSYSSKLIAKLFDKAIDEESAEVFSCYNHFIVYS